MQVVIIGAGIVGASLAFTLSQQGADVTVIDASGPAAGATGRSFGWATPAFTQISRITISALKALPATDG